MSSILKKDSELQFPLVQVLTASAGSGKTDALAHRLVQFLLSKAIPSGDLRQILAVTFTNNAAAEMKTRVLKLLKQICLESLDGSRIPPLINCQPKALRLRAGEAIELILDHYSDFQVKTIDSFMASVFKASALDFGLTADAEISLESDRALDRVFEQEARSMRSEVELEKFMRDVVDPIDFSRKEDSGYIWDPYKRVKTDIKGLYRIIGRYPEPLTESDETKSLVSLRTRILSLAGKLNAIISGKEKLINKNFRGDVAQLLKGDVIRVLEKTPKHDVVNKDGQSAPWRDEVEALADQLREALGDFARVHARQFYQPYVRLIGRLDEQILSAGRSQDEVYLGDVHRRLAQRLKADDVPDMYQRLGDQIVHFLVDEFQDTTPIQWANLRLLIENAIASGGSLFVVGDTKQSIYAFNGADWRIMKEMEDPASFPSAQLYDVARLPHNYRSDGVLVEFCKEVFQKRLPDDLHGDESGLTDYVQEALEHRREAGYVTVRHVEREEDENDPARDPVMSLVRDVIARGYAHGDVAILAVDNVGVVTASSWLNEAGVPFISHSSLDVRRRKMTGEIIALLRFLNSPIDDLSLASFLTGECFEGYLALTGRPALDGHALIFEHRVSGKGPLYKAFQEKWPDLWSECFESLLSQVGYLPLYDLATQVFDRFRIFENTGAEAATAAKLLEIFKDFEQNENNSLKDFLDPQFEDRLDWELQVPTEADAVHVMTIHKAKGLGFPVVIVIISDDKLKMDQPLIRRTEEGVSLLHITKKAKEWHTELASTYDAAERKMLVDHYNRLYVALTRAEHEMHIIVSRDKGHWEKMFGALPFAKGRPGRGKARHTEERAPLLPQSGNRLDAVKEYHPDGLQSRKRGDRIHRVFEKIQFLEHDIEAQVVKAAQSASDNPDPDEVRVICDALALPALHDLFLAREGRSVMVEQEFADSNGQLFRMDRIVVDQDAVTVIDFKTSADERPEYAEQVGNYAGMLRLFYPLKKVKGLIAYVDLGICREVA